MELKLTRPICFFDLETTGIDVAKDRIVEIAIFKVFPNGNKESKTWLVNPTVPIPPQSTAVHGISNEKVANEPTFKELASVIYNMIKEAIELMINQIDFQIQITSLSGNTFYIEGNKPCILFALWLRQKNEG